MRETIDAPSAGLAGLARKIQALASGLSCAASLVAPVVLRAALAVPFFKSGLTRWDGFAALSPATAYLFDHLNPGAQKFTPGKDDAKALEYGKSITDACLSWGDSLDVLETLSASVLARRAR